MLERGREKSSVVVVRVRILALSEAELGVSDEDLRAVLYEQVSKRFRDMDSMRRTFIPCALSTTQRAASLDVNSSSADMLLLADGTTWQQKYPSSWPNCSTIWSAHMAS